MKYKLKKKYIKYLIIVLVVVILIVALILLFTHKSDDGLKYNKNKSFVSKQEVEGIVFKDIKCTYDGKNSLISYKMVNNTKKKIYLENYDVIVKDKNNNRLTRISAHVTQTLKAKESVEMANQVVGIDLSDAYYMELIVNTKKKKDN